MSQIQVPKGWGSEKLVDLCVDFQPGFAQGQKNVENGTIHLRMNNIGTNFKINFDLVRTINATKKQLEKYKLEKNDIIFNNTNSPKLVGKSAIYEDSKICLYSNHLTRVKVNSSKLTPKWLLYFFQYKWLKRDFEEMCHKWINQAAVGKNKIKFLDIPLPTLNTQKKIIQKLDYILEKLEEKRKIIYENQNNNKNEMKKFIEISKRSFIKRCLLIENFPSNWRNIEIKTILDLSSGKAKTKSRLEKEGKYPVYGGNGITGYSNEFLIDYDTIVIGRVGAYCGSIHISPAKSWITDNAMYCIFKEKINLYFLSLLFNYLNFNKFSKIGAQPSISQEKILSTKIFVPPYPEQETIVTNWNNLNGKILKIQTFLNDIEKSHLESKAYLENLFSSILNKAFLGKLVN